MEERGTVAAPCAANHSLPRSAARGEENIMSEVNHIIQPWDQHNQALAANVHPADWQNPTPAPCYNLVVIGAGTAGLVAAAGAAGLGARVALVEKHLLGGDCLNYGCVPSKALLRAARAFADVRDASSFGVRVPEGTVVDFPAVMERMRRIRAEISPHDSALRFRELGIDVFLGSARFTAPNTVETGGQTLRFSKAVIATGARAAALPIPGLAEAGFLTNETVFSLTELPRRLAVIGAGPIGCELAQAFRRFGSEVFVLEAASQILGREDPDAANVVEKAFLRDGIKLLCRAKIQKVEARQGEKIVHFQCDKREEQLAVDAILIGVGRVPNVDGLGLDAAGVRYSKSGIEVNDYLQTTNRRIHAAGDVCLKYKFTHTADAAARIVIQNALFLGRKKVSSLVVPWCTYTDPEIAHVGMYEDEAAKSGIPVRTFSEPMGRVDRAILDGETDGLIKIHIHKRSGKIVGATIVARHAGEMISELTTAISAGLKLSQLAEVIHPYPTQAEAIKRCADACKRTQLTPTVKTLLQRWLQ
jgi:pyruvate/2-oxoglutarate dehydrogenase complex dihydrolipoamide dehydrogenase (E3) component